MNVEKVMERMSSMILSEKVELVRKMTDKEKDSLIAAGALTCRIEPAGPWHENKIYEIK